MATLRLERPHRHELEAAAERLKDVATRTPLVSLQGVDATPDILLKLEIHQPVGSFKIRGVYNVVANLTDERRQCGISTVSAGNTAQALAWCGRRFGVPARSLMPDTAPITKIDAVRAYGGEAVLVPIAEVFRFLREHAWEDEPFAFVHPWTNRDVMIGHGSMGLEIIADCPDVDTVFVPVGGGGLIAGVGSAVKALRPSVRLVAVEPEGCPSLHESVRLGRPASVSCETFCDGVAVPYITDEMYPLLRDLVDDVVLVPERQVKAMVRHLATRNRIVTEGSGALAAAAAITAPEDARGRAVAIVSGGSIDPAKLVSILSDAPG